MSHLAGSERGVAAWERGPAAVRSPSADPASDRLAEQRREFSDLELESFPFGHQTIQFGG
jgi:hypothetical protein